MHKSVIAVASATVLLAGCSHEGIQGTPAAESSPVTSMTSTGSAAMTATSPTTSADPVKGTTFDGCAAPTNAELTSWGVDPAKKRDAHETAFGQQVRGCVWGGHDWYVKVYAIDGSLSELDQPQAQFDRQERIQVGSRSGWLVHTTNAASCSVGIPSQQAIASVQVDLKTDLTEQHYDQCPLAIKIITALEPRIP